MLTSPFSDWTDPVVIPSRFQFFVQKFQKNNNNDVFFDVFAKKPGVAGGVEKNTVRVAPGDSIGLSGSLLVDVRQTSDVQVSRRSWYFVITDPEGNVQRHDVTHDKDDPAYKDLLERTGGSARRCRSQHGKPQYRSDPDRRQTCKSTCDPRLIAIILWSFKTPVVGIAVTDLSCIGRGARLRVFP